MCVCVRVVGGGEFSCCSAQEHSYCPSPAYSVHTHSMPIPVVAPRSEAERSRAELLELRDWFWL